ncbi:MAG: lysophospholipid acyltransferase family protein [bacterium]
MTIEYLEYFLFNLINSIARSLSFRSAERCGAALGGAVFALTGFRKRITFDNLTKAFPEKSSDEIKNIARGAYRSYGIAVVQSMWASNKSAEELRSKVRVLNPEIMENALGLGKGVIFLSAHYGSWELLPTSVRLHFDRPFFLLAQRQRNAHINAIIEAHRTRFGNATTSMGLSSRRVLTALAEQNIVLILGDQSGPREAVFIDFFGRPSATHRGAAAFSLKTGAPIVTGFLVRQQDGTYEITLEEVDRSGLNSSGEENIVELTRRHVVILEKWIRMHPDLWLWMHKRWKHTPYYEQHQLMEEKA